jgi:NAD(P)-dependent dehydrogenase (short-subunit alcohol dehydrogenase family)
MPGSISTQTVLLIGASRGLGLAMAEEYLKRGWHVVGTVRGEGTPLHELATRSGGALEIETVDINFPDRAVVNGRRPRRRVRGWRRPIESETPSN